MIIKNSNSTITNEEDVEDGNYVNNNYMNINNKN